MSLFGRLLGRLRPQARQPQAGWRVEIDDDALTVHPPDAGRFVTPMADIARIEIRTSDAGPWSADLHWFFFGADGEAMAVFPQGARGEEAAVDRLTELPGFDHDAMIKAVTCTENAVFPVWQAPAASARR